jgi:hypothetical protein
VICPAFVFAIVKFSSRMSFAVFFTVPPLANVLPEVTTTSRFEPIPTISTYCASKVRPVAPAS